MALNSAGYSTSSTNMQMLMQFMQLFLLLAVVFHIQLTQIVLQLCGFLLSMVLYNLSILVLNDVTVSRAVFYNNSLTNLMSTLLLFMLSIS